MKRIFSKTLAFASLVLLSGAAAAQITDTPHNFTTSGGTNNVAEQTDTNQICVFCHTPHGSDTSAAVPLWNKKIPANTNYQVYNSVAATKTSTIDGSIAAVGSVSAACLSCHDGTQAMDNMMNAPGSGVGLGSGVSQAYATWTGTQTGADLGKIATGIANLGQDLTNDHPIGIQYCGGGITTGSLTTCGDKDFIDGTGTATKKLQYDTTKGIFWVDVDGGTTGTREKTDIALFNRSDVTGPSVECASCHDPHKAKGSDDVHFMRVATANSKICLACHVK